MPGRLDARSAPREVRPDPGQLHVAAFGSTWNVVLRSGERKDLGRVE